MRTGTLITLAAGIFIRSIAGLALVLYLGGVW